MTGELRLISLLPTPTSASLTRKSIRWLLPSLT